MRAATAVFIATISTSSVLAGPGTPSAIDGVWIADRDSEITIAPCDVGHCGYLSKIVVPPDIYAANKAEIDLIGVSNFRDYNNKDPNLRDRPMLGLQILTLVTPLPGGAYEGSVYNPEDGNEYYGKLEVIGPNHIRLTGCAMFNLLCQSQDWKRAPEQPTGAINAPNVARLESLPGTPAEQPMPEPLGGNTLDLMGSAN